MSAISTEVLDPRFKSDLAERLGGSSIKRCFACGTCTASCPVSRIIEGFDPRKIIHMILLGNKEQVLTSDLIWYCSLCNTCSFVCPQDVRFSEAMVILRQMAVEGGYISGSFLSKWQEVEKIGQRFRAEMSGSLLAAKDCEGEINLVQFLKDAYTFCIVGK
jgi:heterodisulfide reductase subunit C